MHGAWRAFLALSSALQVPGFLLQTVWSVGKTGIPGSPWSQGVTCPVEQDVLWAQRGGPPRANLLPSTPITFLAEGYLKEGGWGKGGRLGDGSLLCEGLSPTPKNEIVQRDLTSKIGTKGDEEPDQRVCVMGSKPHTPKRQDHSVQHAILHSKAGPAVSISGVICKT